MRLPSGMRKIFRRLGLTLGLLLGVAAVLLLALQFSWVRGVLLREIVQRASNALPGTLVVRQAAWPGFSHLRFSDVVWTSSGDTLAQLELVELRWSSRALLMREIRVYEAQVVVSTLDLPQLQSVLRTTEDSASSSQAEDSAGLPWLRAGSVPGVPSVVVEALHVVAKDVQLSETLRITEGALELAFDLRHGAAPRLALTQLRLKMSEPEFEIRQVTGQLDESVGRLQAEVQDADGARWSLSVAASHSTTDSLVLQVKAGPFNQEPLDVLTLRGLFRRQGARVVGLQFTSQITTPGIAELRDLPFLQDKLQEIPDLAGVVIEVGGALQWEPSWGSELQVQVQPNSWLAGGGFRLHHDHDSLYIADMELSLAGLHLEGQWQRDAVAASGQWQATIRGTQWLRDVFPQVAVPESLGLDLVATLRSRGTTHVWQADLRAGLRHGNVLIEDLRLTAGSVNDSLQKVRFHLQTRMPGWDIQTAGDIAMGDEIQAKLEPIVVVQSSSAPLLRWTRPLVAPTGSMHLAWSSSSGLQLRHLQITGDLGEWQAQAQWQAQAGGSASLQAKWPQPPGVLLHVVAADSMQLHSLRQRWRQDVVPELQLQVQLPPLQGERTLDATGYLVLPGPRSFAQLLPDSIRVDDLDAIRASLSFHWQGDSLRSEWQAAVDFSETAWLDSTGIRAYARGDSLFLESLRFLWDGVDVRLAGVSDSANVFLEGGLRLDATSLLHRLPHSWRTNAALMAQANWTIAGSPESPELDVELWSQVRTPWGQVPQLHGELHWSQGALQVARLEAPEGLTTGDLQWDHLQLDVRPLMREGRSMSKITFDLAGKQQALHAALRLERNADTIVYGDSLYLRIFDGDLVTPHPFLVRWSPEAGVRVDNFDMRGTLGSISASVVAGEDTLGLLATMDLQLPDLPDGWGIPAGLWPRSLKLRAAIADNDSLALFLEASGMQVGTRSDLRLVTEVQVSRDSTIFLLRMVDPEGVVVDVRGNVPLQWSVRPTEFVMGDGVLRLDAQIADLPLPESFGNPLTSVGYLDRSKSEWGPRLAGEFHLGGSPVAPSGYGTVRLQQQAGALSAYKANLVVGLSPDGKSAWSAEIDEAIRRLSNAAILINPGGNMAFWVTRDTTRVLEGVAHVPLTLSYSQGRFHVPSDLQMEATIHSPSLSMKNLTEFLPAGIRIDGILSIDLRATGALDNPRLGGGLQFTNLALEVPEGSRIRASGKIELNGTARHPGVTGNVTVRDGLIRIPELPRSLLPLEGDALLLADDAVVESVADSGALLPTPLVTARTDSSGVLARPALSSSIAEGRSEVFLDIPGAFWIRGRGFEVELSGNLQLTMAQGNTRVLGELKAERGNLKLMASKFPIKSGRVSFFGDDETNPSLDLVMGRDYNNVSIEVVVQGTAKDPKIEFRSNPPLSEDEILSYILFGRGSSQLDEAQSSQFDERALALASVLASSLGEGIRDQTGVDMIGLEQGADTADRASLVVGKYLSPRVLLKYVFDLETGRGYTINVEYWLRGGLRVMTTSSRYNQSGLELNWSHDY